MRKLLADPEQRALILARNLDVAHKQRAIYRIYREFIGKSIKSNTPTLKLTSTTCNICGLDHVRPLPKRIRPPRPPAHNQRKRQAEAERRAVYAAFRQMNLLPESKTAKE